MGNQKGYKIHFEFDRAFEVWYDEDEHSTEDIALEHVLENLKYYGIIDALKRSAWVEEIEDLE